MKKDEQLVWEAMRSRAPEGVGLWLQRIECFDGLGIPDVYCAYRGRSAWVELKAATEPKRHTSKLLGKSCGLRPSQIAWHTKAHSVGLESYVLIRIKMLDSLGRFSVLVDGVHARELNDMTTSQIESVAVAKGWTEIFKRLTEGQQ